jgi:hypothetical protein
VKKSLSKKPAGGWPGAPGLASETGVIIHPPASSQATERTPCVRRECGGLKLRAPDAGAEAPHQFFLERLLARLKSPHRRRPVDGDPDKPCPCYRAFLGEEVRLSRHRAARSAARVNGLSAGRIPS